MFLFQNYLFNQDAIDINIFMKVRKLWSFGKDIRMVKDTSLSKHYITENHRKLDVSENTKRFYDYRQHELHESNTFFAKVN